MKESYSKGVTNHTDLESCAVGREANLEALTKACTGQPSSRESTLLQGADTVGESGRPYRRSRKREGQPNPARSKNLTCTEQSPSLPRLLMSLMRLTKPASRNPP